MANEIFAYAGRLVTQQPPAESSAGREVGDQPLTPDQARAEAARIIADAHAEAAAIKERKFDAMNAEFERVLADRIVSEMSAFSLGLEDCAATLSKIVQQALAEIVGDTRAPEAIWSAIAKATSKHQADAGLQVLVSPKDFPRLELIRLGLPVGAAQRNIKVVADPSMEPGRCLLNAGGRRYDISLQAQLNAFRNLSDKIAASAAINFGDPQ